MERYTDMRDKYDKLFVKAMRRLFRAVGLTYTPPLTKPDWYLQHTWTHKDQEKFRVWLEAECRKAGMRRIQARNEAAWFLLDFGWKVED